MKGEGKSTKMFHFSYHGNDCIVIVKFGSQENRSKYILSLFGFEGHGHDMLY